MLKKLLLILIFSLILPVIAGEYEDALKNNEKIFLYFYTDECGYCQKFKPFFESFSKIYEEKCKFLAIDGNTNYGKNLAQNFRIRFLPYVILVDVKKENGLVINPDCLQKYSCTNDIIKEFIK